MIRVITATVLLACLAVGAWADQVQLVTGEVLQGHVVATNDQTVTLEHPVLGRLVIPVKSVRLVIYSGKKTKGARLLAPATQLSSSQPATSAAAAATQPVASTQPLPNATSRAQVAQALKTPAKVAAKPPAKVWKSQLTLAFLGDDGTNGTLGGNVGIKSQKTTLDNRTTLDAAFYYAETTVQKTTNTTPAITSTSWQTTQNEATAGFAQDWLIRNSKWFWFGNGRFDYAEFRPYRERLTGSTGPGYQLLKDKDWDVVLRLGAGGSQEFGTQGDNGFHPEGSFGETMSWNISPKQKFSLAETFYADLGILGQNRNIASADWTIKLDTFSGLSFKLSFQDEYDSFIANNTGNISHNDAKLLGGLELDF